VTVSVIVTWSPEALTVADGDNAVSNIIRPVVLVSVLKMPILLIVYGKPVSEPFTVYVAANEYELAPPVCAYVASFRINPPAVVEYSEASEVSLTDGAVLFVVNAIYQYGAFPGRIANVVVAVGVVAAVPPGVDGVYHWSTVRTLLVLAVITP
jgi:hypothetical protein